MGCMTHMEELQSVELSPSSILLSPKAPLAIYLPLLMPLDPLHHTSTELPLQWHALQLLWLILSSFMKMATFQFFLILHFYNSSITATETATEHQKKQVDIQR
ncbi:hypothetical protein XENOCAPTIV_016397 [Xenoophorus captivus]|uniref:Uncharacterized protein n=1 Tax=Xenoophorus captivus TaxID=1517983 RepID=A0ABV0RHL9_9TELE